MFSAPNILKLGKRGCCCYCGLGGNIEKRGQDVANLEEI